MKVCGMRMFILVALYVGCAQTAFGQNTSADNSTAILKSKFDTQMSGQLRLYNGVKYTAYSVYYTGNGYFNSPEVQNATLYYDGSTFNNIPARFDIYRNMVVVNYLDTADKISLINSKLDSFIMSGHKFIRIDANKSIDGGFYELLYNGKTQLIKRYSVEIQDDRSGSAVRHQFYQNTTFYIRKNGVYNSVSSRGSVLSLLKDRKKELNEYIKLDKLNANPSGPDVAKVLLYYDTLNK